MAETVNLLPLTKAEKAALLTAVTMVLQTFKAPTLDPVGQAMTATIKPLLESVSKKLKS